MYSFYPFIVRDTEKVMSFVQIYWPIDFLGDNGLQDALDRETLNFDSSYVHD